MRISLSHFALLYEMMGGSLYISLSSGWSWIKCHLLMTLVRLLPAMVGADKNIPPRQICFNCFSLIVTQFRIACGLKSIFHRFCIRPHVGIWTASHVSMRFVLVSDSFIPKGPWEVLWLVQAHRPVFGLVKLAPIKYESPSFCAIWNPTKHFFESLGTILNFKFKTSFAV